APATPETRLQLWHAYAEESAEEEGLREAVRAFSREHPSVQVELLANAFGAYASKLESAIPTGQGPDLFIDAHERISNYVEMGLVVPPQGIDIEGFEPRTLSSLRLASPEGEEILYGLPLSMKCAALYLNTALLPGSIESLEGLLEAPLADGVYPLAFEAENAYYVAALLHARGGQMLDEEGGFAFVGLEAEQTLEALQAMIREGSIPEEATGDLVQRMFASGGAAATISGPWLAPDLPEDLPWRVIPLPPLRPSGAPMVPYATIEALFFTPALGNEPARDDARRALAEYLSRGEGARIRARVGRQIVAFEGVWQDASLGEDPFLSAFRSAARAALPMPTHPHMRMVFEPAQRALRKVLRAGEPPASALAEAERRFAEMLRPLPEPSDPAFALLLLSFLLLLGTFALVRRAREPAMRQALRESLPAYRWIAHAVLAVGLLVILPLAVGAGTSFFAGRGRDLYYAGLSNYVDILTARGGDLFASGSFWVVLGVTLLWTTLNLALHLGIGVALALLLYRPALKLKGLYRVLLILPWAVPSYVTALAWKGMFHRQLGAVNAILEGLGFEAVSFFAHFSTAFAANLATNVWLGFPFMMVVTLGALSAIPSDVYEAAAVDGASRWQRFRLITLPLLRPSLAPAVAMGAVWTFNMFNVVFLVSGGEPDGSTEILVSEAYRWAFTRSNQYGYAAAYAVLIFLILVFGTKLSARWVERARGAA
ncbi:MAG: extracellular solute-binding protein, partial [Myxococcales bacterium]|nr:extracellular solute-binding protein [Myxococcales bacterium]